MNGKRLDLTKWEASHGRMTKTQKGTRGMWALEVEGRVFFVDGTLGNAVYWLRNQFKSINKIIGQTAIIVVLP